MEPQSVLTLTPTRIEKRIKLDKARAPTPVRGTDSNELKMTVDASGTTIIKDKDVCYTVESLLGKVGMPG